MPLGEKRAWHIENTLFHSGFLVVTLVPMPGVPEDEQEGEAPWTMAVFPETAFYAFQGRSSYDDEKPGFRPSSTPYRSIAKDNLFKAAAARMVDPGAVKRLHAWRVAGLNGCVDVYCAGRPWTEPNASRRSPTFHFVRDDLILRSHKPLRRSAAHPSKARR